jgi:dethiobiotin synthase
MSDLFVTGTDTNVGKTILSALLTARLDATYWKPIQTGCEGGRVETDRQTVIRSAEIDESRTRPEHYLFDPPISPHLAALQAGVKIDLAAIQRPHTDPMRPLVIEGAGGVLVPVNDQDTMLDLMRQLGAPIILATRTTLGTINHTLLSLNAIRHSGLTVAGVVMIGDENRDRRDAIQHYGEVPVVGWIPHLARIDRAALLEVFENHFDRAAFDR